MTAFDVMEKLCKIFTDLYGVEMPDAIGTDEAVKEIDTISFDFNPTELFVGIILKDGEGCSSTRDAEFDEEVAKPSTEGVTRAAEDIMDVLRTIRPTVDIDMGLLVETMHAGRFIEYMTSEDKIVFSWMNPTAVGPRY